MKKIPQEHLHKTLPLYLNEGSEFPLIRAVIESKQDGVIYADNETAPSSCFALTKFGFVFMFGGQNNAEFNSSVAQMVGKDHVVSLAYMLWYNPPKVWRDRLDLLPKGLVKKRERIRFSFDASRYWGLKPEEKKLPAHFELKKIDRDIIGKTGRLGIGFPNRFWRSADDFLSNGFGFCLLKDQEVAGICYTACLVAGLAEVDIVTLEEHRGLGLGTALTHAFVEYCFGNDIEPTWDCFVYNMPSRKIAAAAGFIEKERYPFYSFSRPFHDVKITEDFYRW